MDQVIFNHQARNSAIYHAREAGRSYTEIAREWGISPVRTSQIYHRQVRMRREIQERQEQLFCQPRI